MRFFDYNGGFITWFNRITNMIFISILWVICCIPIVTAGASTAALYYTIQKNIKNDRDNTGAVFWEGLKQNFKQSFLADLILLAVAGIFYADMTMAQSFSSALAMLFRFLILLVCVYAFWIFAYIARFDCKLGTYLKNTAFMMFRHLSVTVSIALLGIGSVVLIWTMKFLILILPSVTVLVMSILTERVFRRYMSEEDKAMEDERNRDYRDEYIGKRRDMKNKKQQ